MNIANHFRFAEHDMAIILCVAMEMSNGEVHFCGLSEGVEYHRDVVQQFCSEHGFHSTEESPRHSGVILRAAKGEITLRVLGGSTLDVLPDRTPPRIIESRESAHYGPLEREIVEYCILDTLRQQGLEGWEVELMEESYRTSLLQRRQ